jgi:hypothetical protein
MSQAINAEQTISVDAPAIHTGICPGIGIPHDLAAVQRRVRKDVGVRIRMLTAQSAPHTNTAKGTRPHDEHY